MEALVTLTTSRLVPTWKRLWHWVAVMHSTTADQSYQAKRCSSAGSTWRCLLQDHAGQPGSGLPL